MRWIYINRDEAVSILAEALNRIVGNKLLQFADGTLIVNQRIFMKTYQGYAFTAGHRFENVASDSEVNAALRVPEDAGREVFFIVVEVSTLAQAYIDLCFDAYQSGGTELKPVNLKRSMKDQISPVAEALHSVTYTPGEDRLPLVHSGGSKQFAVGGLTELGGSAILAPGCDAVVAVTNKSASSQDISIRLLWWEDEL